MNININNIRRAVLILLSIIIFASACQKALPYSKEKNDDKNAQTERFFFAKGVSVEKGWHDVEKLKKPEDIMACWLITASNMLQWWQDRYTQAGHKLPVNTPHGQGTGPYKSAIFDDAITKFNEMSRGANISAGLLWYVDGRSEGISNHSHPKPGTGGYLKNIGESRLDYSKKAFMDYDDWKNKGENEDVLKIFSEKLLKELKRGSAIGMDIQTHVGFGGLLHAITLWGAEVDEKGLISHIYITDSDDYIHQLVRCSVEVCDNPFNTKEIAMNVPVGKAYEKGRKWAVLRLLYIAPPL